MSDKYPGLSPFVYCADNPLIFKDPDGNRIIAADNKSKKFIKAYLKEHFGSTKMFRFSSSGEMKIRKNKFNSILNSVTPNQVNLLNGMKDAINRPEIVQVHVNKNSDNFNIVETRGDIDYTRDVMTDKSGLTMEPSRNILDYHILINNERAENELFSSTTSRKIGKDDEISYTSQTGKSASSIFFHELLDEFLDYYTKKAVSNRSPKDSKVFFHNKALENLGKNKRDGSDHD